MSDKGTNLTTWKCKASLEQDEENEVLIKANKEGLIALANILLSLADAQEGMHFHLDTGSGLHEDSNVSIVIQKENL